LRRFMGTPITLLVFQAAAASAAVIDVEVEATVFAGGGPQFNDRFDKDDTAIFRFSYRSDARDNDPRADVGVFDMKGGALTVGDYSASALTGRLTQSFAADGRKSMSFTLGSFDPSAPMTLVSDPITLPDLGPPPPPPTPPLTADFFNFSFGNSMGDLFAGVEDLPGSIDGSLVQSGSGRVNFSNGQGETRELRFGTNGGGPTVSSTTNPDGTVSVNVVTEVFTGLVGDPDKPPLV